MFVIVIVMYVQELVGGTEDIEAFVFDWENVHSTFDKLLRVKGTSIH